MTTAPTTKQRVKLCAVGNPTMIVEVEDNDDLREKMWEMVKHTGIESITAKDSENRIIAVIAFFWHRDR